VQGVLPDAEGALRVNPRDRHQAMARVTAYGERTSGSGDVNVRA
jgi:hypothetical protein